VRESPPGEYFPMICSYVLAASNYTHVYIYTYDVPAAEIAAGQRSVGAPLLALLCPCHTLRMYIYTHTYDVCIRVCVRILIYRIYKEDMCASLPPPPAGHSHAVHPTNSIVHLMYMIIRRGQRRHCRDV